MKKLFGQATKSILLSGIEHLYRDPASRRYYFIQSFGGTLYVVDTSVELAVGRKQSLKQVEITHAKTDNDHRKRRFMKKLGLKLNSINCTRNCDYSDLF